MSVEADDDRLDLRTDDAVETCPNDDTQCGGERALRGGVLPCFECAKDASAELWATFERRAALRRAFAPEYDAMGGST